MKNFILLQIFMMSLIISSSQMYSYNSTNAKNDLHKAGKAVAKSAKNTGKGLFGNNNLSEAEKQKMQQDVVKIMLRDNIKMKQDTDKLICELNQNPTPNKNKKDAQGRVHGKRKTEQDFNNLRE